MPEWAIATPHGAATAAGERAFAAGGNALDAALAAAAALTVVYPHNCALGGDLFALVRRPDGEITSVNASGAAPAGADVAALRRRGAALPVTGPETITVPGLVDGWGTLHGLGAGLPWADALRSAIGLAEDGEPVAASLAAAIAESPGVASDPGMAAVFAPRGTPLREGDVLRQVALAATLRALAADGARAFYDGEVGERLAAGLAAHGAALRAADLRAHATELQASLSAGFRGLRVHTSPPNSSGVLLLQALAALERAELDDPLGADAGALAAILQAGGEQRDRLLGDPRAAGFEPDDWLGEARLAEIVARARGVRPAVMGTADAPRPGGDTVAVVAADASGRAVSLIQSLFHSFGAQILEPDTGVLLHNRGTFFSLREGHPNCLAPGRRPAHTLLPVLVERDRRLLGVLGTMGGKVHAQIHAHVLLRLLDGAAAQEAVDAPRWAIGGMEAGEPDDTIRVEAGVPPAARAALAEGRLRLIDLPYPSEWLGHAQAIWAAGPLDAGSDRRADGAAAAAPR